MCAERKFGPGGILRSLDSGPVEGRGVIKGGVDPYSDEFVACLGEVAHYIYDTHGHLPSTYTTIVLTVYVQAVHRDTYDTHFQPGAYLPTHSQHWERWHSPYEGGWPTVGQEVSTH